MISLGEKASQLKFLFDKFLVACDSFEEIDKWDKDSNGEMEAYYTSDLMAVVLKLITSDNEIEEGEVSFVNEIFDTDYSLEELTDVYGMYNDIIAESFATNFVDGVDMLRGISEKLADMYVEMYELLADAAAESDGEIELEEKEVFDFINSML